MKTLLVTLVSVAISGAAWALDTRTVTDDLGRVIEIPADPQRIVSLDDNSITLPLIDLGVDLYGSAGRISEAGTPFVRGLLDTEEINVAASDLLPACADGQLIFMPYEPAGAPTFAALNASLDIISSQIATRAATRSRASPCIRQSCHFRQASTSRSRRNQ